MCVPGAHGGQTRASDPLKLESETAVNYHAGGMVNGTEVLGKNSKSSSPLSQLSCCSRG